jgi:hypothetical protein
MPEVNKSGDNIENRCPFLTGTYSYIFPWRLYGELRRTESSIQSVFHSRYMLPFSDY